MAWNLFCAHEEYNILLLCGCCDSIDICRMVSGSNRIIIRFHDCGHYIETSMSVNMYLVSKNYICLMKLFILLS